MVKSRLQVACVFALCWMIAGCVSSQPRLAAPVTGPYTVITPAGKQKMFLAPIHNGQIFGAVDGYLIDFDPTGDDRRLKKIVAETPAAYRGSVLRADASRLAGKDANRRICWIVALDPMIIAVDVERVPLVLRGFSFVRFAAADDLSRQVDRLVIEESAGRRTVKLEPHSSVGDVLLRTESGDIRKAPAGNSTGR